MITIQDPDCGAITPSIATNVGSSPQAAISQSPRCSSDTFARHQTTKTYSKQDLQPKKILPDSPSPWKQSARFLFFTFLLGTRPAGIGAKPTLPRIACPPDFVPHPQLPMMCSKTSIAQHVASALTQNRDLDQFTRPLLARLTAAKKNLMIDHTDQTSQYNLHEHRITWNPRLGVGNTDGLEITPRAVLAHELGHAAFRAAYPQTAYLLNLLHHPIWASFEERRNRLEFDVPYTKSRSVPPSHAPYNTYSFYHENQDQPFQTRYAQQRLRSPHEGSNLYQYYVQSLKIIEESAPAIKRNHFEKDAAAKDLLFQEVSMFPQIQKLITGPLSAKPKTLKLLQHVFHENIDLSLIQQHTGHIDTERLEELEKNVDTLVDKLKRLEKQTPLGHDEL